jgi:hypothetical protein
VAGGERLRGLRHSQPHKRDLLARRYNAIAKADKVATPQTSDNDIERRRWIYIDFDPERPAKISATEEEKAKAF